MPETDEYCQSCRGQDWKDTEKGDPCYLGTVVQIRDRSRCPKCRFVARCLQTNATVLESGTPVSHHETPTHVQTCWADSELSLTLGMSESVIERLLITANQPKGFSIVVRVEPEPYGERIAPQIDFSVAIRWLQNCEKHVACRQAQSSQPDTTSVSSNLTFIDVNRYRLVQPHKRVAYLALSYVWGTHPQDYTETVPKEKLAGGDDDDLTVLDKQPVALMDRRLPQTLLDAICFTKAVGYRYLWIDALCIPQDDSQAKLAQISDMDLIYGDSACTLIAFAGKDSLAGLPGVSVSSARHFFKNSERIFPESDKYWMEAIEDLYDAASHSHWATRAWTLQEGLLSQKLIVFSKRQMYFICSTTCVSEAGADVPTHTISKPNFLTSSIYQPAEAETDSEKDLHLIYSLAARYANFASLYSQRTLGWAQDCLGAFKGVLSMLERSHPSFVAFCGLPCKYFGRWMLWEEDPRSDTIPSRPTNWDKVNWPSWSWVGHWVPIVNQVYNKYLTGSLDCNVRVAPLHIPEAEFALFVNDVQSIPLQHWVLDQRSHAGRRGISHTRLGRVRLMIKAFAVQTQGTEWHKREVADDSRKWHYDHKSWSASITFDSIHFGAPLSAALREGELYLVAVAADCIEPNQELIWSWNEERVCTLESLDLSLLVVCIGGDGHFERIGTAKMQVSQFLDNAQTRTFSFDDPTWMQKSRELQ